VPYPVPNRALKFEGIFCVPGAYTPVLAKHSKHFSLEDSLAIGVDRMQRNFGPLKQLVEEWRAMQLSTAAAKLLIYQAFIEGESGFPKHLARRVHDMYFQPLRIARRNGCNAVCIVTRSLPPACRASRSF
jgi:hypothetical protein